MPRGVEIPQQEVDRVIALVEEHGPDRVKVAKLAGIRLPQLAGIIAGHKDQYDAARAEFYARRALEAANPVAQSIAARKEAEKLDHKMRDLYDWVRPVELPPLPRVKATTTPADAFVVFSDTHCPLEDARALAVVYKVVEELRPHTIIGNGDIVDLMSVSKYPKDLRAGKSWPLRDEQRAAKSLWRTLADIGKGWGVTLVETESNHGAGLEGRFIRYLNDRVPELFTMDGFEEALTYQRFFHPSDVPVELVPEVIISESLRVRHGRVVRKYGGYSGRATGEQLGGSVIMGHTHRQGSSLRLVHGIPGVDESRTIRTFETGLVGRLGIDYAPDADWVQGFAVILPGSQRGSYGVELITVEHGVACVAALGKEVRA